MADEDITIIKPRVPRRFELTQNVSGFLEGGFDDWPAQIQDQVMMALNAKSEAERIPLQLVAAKFDIDYGEAVGGSQDQPYILVIAAEIIDEKVVFDAGKIDEYMRPRTH